jgi:hypothetical protein
MQIFAGLENVAEAGTDTAVLAALSSCGFDILALL